MNPRQSPATPATRAEMAARFVGRDITSMRDFSTDELLFVLDLSEEFDAAV